MDDQVLIQIVRAVDAILDPNTSPSDRTTAHSICESCKESEMSCLIGYALASKQDAAQHVKHFGLQLMQQFISNRWTKAPQEDQIQTKNNAVQLIKNCNPHESCFVKDGVAHVLAEVIKHVWPQQWPSMVQDLLGIAKLGVVQTELVELVFLRIAEDVAVLRTISAAHRSQDIRHGLSLSMGELMEFFMTILEQNSAKYASLLGTSNEAELVEVKVHYTLSCTTLRTLQGFLEWISTEHVFAKEGAYVHLLCKLLEVKGLKVMAAECLTLAVHQKGQAVDRKRILVLTTPLYVQVMVKAIQKAIATPSTDEEPYLFLKRIGGLISCLATQLVSAWSFEESNENEGTISDLSSHTALLDVMLDFLRQENPVLSDAIASSWQQILQNRGMSKDLTLLTYIPDLLKISGTEIKKSLSTNLPVYTQLDFNDSDEAELFLSMHRNKLLQIIRGCACALPNQCMLATMEWLTMELQSAVDPGTDENGVKQEQCSHTSPTYLRWEALRSILETTIKTGISQAKKQEIIDSIPVEAAKQLLTMLLRYETGDILLCQCLLSFIGTLLPMLPVFDQKKEVMIGIIEKMSKMVKYSANHTDRYGKLVIPFRRHSLSAILHLCKYYPSFVMLAYDNFKEAMGEFFNDMLGNLEKVCICESLVLVSGEWNNYANQSLLVREVMSLANNMWLAQDDPRIKTPKDFAAAIGLCSPAGQYGNEAFATFRENISFCVAMTMAMINRSRVPDDPELLKNGGFLDDGNILYPCAEHVLQVMEYIATLVENFHALWTAPVTLVIHKDFQKSLEIRQTERQAMISFNPVTKDQDDRTEKTPWEKMQGFILVVLENCYQILGGVGKCCSVKLYANTSLFPNLLKRAFSNIQTLPELRIRSFTRQFLYYFLKYCPESCYQSVIAPVLRIYCQFMNEVLQTQWAEFAKKEEARLRIFECNQDKMQDYEDLKEDDEILKEQLLRTISREYLEMLVNLFVNKRPHPKNGAKDGDNNASEDSEMLGDSTPAQSVTNTSQLTPMGMSLMGSDIAEVLLATALVSLSWHDTTTAFKGVQMTWALLKHTFNTAPCLPDDAAKFIFESVLLGLQRQGQHEGCAAQLTGLSLFIYITLRPTHDSLLTILQAIPKIDRSALDSFDKGYAKFAEKKRKASFKKLVSKIIEQHVGQGYKCRQEMRRLPRFFQGRKPKSLNIDAGSLGLELFFKPE